MSTEDSESQEAIHDALSAVLTEAGVLDEGNVLTGWCICFESQPAEPDSAPSAGHVYGPTGMTTWRAIGLCEWTTRFGLEPG